MKKVISWLFTTWYGEKSTWWANTIGAMLIIFLLGLILR